MFTGSRDQGVASTSDSHIDRACRPFVCYRLALWVPSVFNGVPCFAISSSRAQGLDRVLGLGFRVLGLGFRDCLQDVVHIPTIKDDDASVGAICIGV